MTRKKVLSMVFAFMLVLNLFVDVRLNSALAAVKPGDVVSPQYTYTKKVVAQLWSDKPGVATCSGKVTVYSKDSGTAIINTYGTFKYYRISETNQPIHTSPEFEVSLL